MIIMGGDVTELFMHLINDYSSLPATQSCVEPGGRDKSEFSNKILVKQAVMLTLIFNNYPFISFWELKSEFYIVMSVFSIIS